MSKALSKRRKERRERETVGAPEVDAELLEAADGDALVAAGAALAEAEVARSPAEADRWRRTADRLESLANVASSLPYMAGGPSGARVGQASALTERIVRPDAKAERDAENAALAQLRDVAVDERSREIDAAKARMEALPEPFRRRLGLLSRIDWRSGTGRRVDGIAIPGQGSGLVDAELVVCEAAVAISAGCGASVERINAMVMALKGIPVEMRHEVVADFAEKNVIRAWPINNPRVFGKACRLAVAWLENPESVVLLDSPGRVSPNVAARVADKALESFGKLPLAALEGPTALLLSDDGSMADARRPLMIEAKATIASPADEDPPIDEDSPTDADEEMSEEADLVHSEDA